MGILHFMDVPQNAYAVILAGGSGSRLWPVSRQEFPKHVQKFFGNQSMMQTTFNRIKPLIPVERILVITNKAHMDLAKEQLPELPAENFIAEPEAKNTALAMGVAAVFVHKRDPEAALIYLAADHLIEDEERFRKIAIVALNTALESNNIVAIGIQPTFAHTGLGYIRIGSQIDGAPSDKENGIFVFQGRGFKEKPNLITAQSFIASREYLWNANIYSWSTITILQAFGKYSPNIKENLDAILNALGTNSQQQVLEEEYQKAENIQIDYAVSEKADNIVVIPGDFGWSDVGDWQIVYQESPKDFAKNVVLGDSQKHLSINTTNTLIHTDKKLVVTIDLDDFVVIDTEDVLMVVPKDKSQDVKKVVEKLKEEKREEYL